MSKLPLTLGTVLLIGLAGCADSAPKKSVDFEKVSTSQEGIEEDQAFALTITLLGLGDHPAEDPGGALGKGNVGQPEQGTDPVNETVPIEGGFVGALMGEAPLAKGLTDADGRVTLQLKPGQSIRLVARAEGWTGEDSGPLLVGASTPGGSCLQWPTGCIVTAGEPERTLGMSGLEGGVTLVLFRPALTSAYPVSVSAHAHVGPVSLPNDDLWAAGPPLVSAIPELQTLYFQRLASLHATLNWTNDAQGRADFRFGLGCTQEAPELETPEDSTDNHLLTSGEVRLELDWEAPTESHWGQCVGFHAGPIVDSANTAMITWVTLDMVFEEKTRYVVSTT